MAASDELQFAASIEAEGKGGTADDNYFDAVVGHLEALIMEPEFNELTQAFTDKHCHEFEDTEENKFVYTDIFKAYKDSTEKHIEATLAARLDGFSMDRFAAMLPTREDQISEDIYEVLLSFTDFLLFKEMMLQAKKAANGDGGEDLGLACLHISGASS